MEPTRIERLICLPMWRLDQKWAERNMYNRFSWWLRKFAYGHCFVGSLLQGLPPVLLAPALGFALSGGKNPVGWGVLAGIFAIVAITYLTYFNRWRVRNGLE